MATETEPNHRTCETDVVIVGCGPAGAMLANLLGLQGIGTLMLEREAEIYCLPRAVHFDDEAMRLVQTVGLADAMQPLVHVSPGMKFLDDTGRLLLDWPRPSEPGPQGWHASYRFHQPEFERVLRDGLARFPSVSLKLRSEVFALDQEADAVVVRYADLSTGGLVNCRARYVVGCEGARSLVRRVIGAPMADLGFHERWLVLDALLKRPRPTWELQRAALQPAAPGHLCPRHRQLPPLGDRGAARRERHHAHPASEGAGTAEAVGRAGRHRA